MRFDAFFFRFLITPRNALTHHLSPDVLEHPPLLPLILHCLPPLLSLQLPPFYRLCLPLRLGQKLGLSGERSQIVTQRHVNSRLNLMKYTDITR